MARDPDRSAKPPTSALRSHLRSQGIGTRLIAHVLEVADGRGVPLVFLEGSPRYDGTRGFEGAGAVGFRSPSRRIPEAAFQVARHPDRPYCPLTSRGRRAPSSTRRLSGPLDCVGLRDPED